jgi:hypothetical protein
VGNVDGVFVNNWVENCLDGFFFEISKGVTVAGNVFVNCQTGVRILNSSHAIVRQNTFVNASAFFQRNERSAAADHFGWHPSTGPDVDERTGHVFVGNLLLADARFPRGLLRVEQAAVLAGKVTHPQLVESDYNLYARPSSAAASPLLTWSPAENAGDFEGFATLAALQKKQPSFEAHSQFLAVAPGGLVRSPDLKNFRPSHALPVAVSESADLAHLLHWPTRASYAPGAFQEEGAEK